MLKEEGKNRKERGMSKLYLQNPWYIILTRTVEIAKREVVA